MDFHYSGYYYTYMCVRTFACKQSTHNIEMSTCGLDAVFPVCCSALLVLASPTVLRTGTRLTGLAKWKLGIETT